MPKWLPGGLRASRSDRSDQLRSTDQLTRSLEPTNIMVGEHLLGDPRHEAAEFNIPLRAAQ
jgi:hypothetical protein